MDDTYRGSGPTKFTCRHEDTMLRLVQTKGDITATSQSGLDPKKKKKMVIEKIYRIGRRDQQFL